MKMEKETRRQWLRRAGGAAGGAAAVLLGVPRAEAANGDPLILGQPNIAGSETLLGARPRAEATLRVDGSGERKPAVWGNTGGGIGVLGLDHTTGVGVKGMTQGNGYGVVAFGPGGEGNAFLALGIVRFSTLHRVVVPQGHSSVDDQVYDWNLLGSTSSVLATLQTPGGQLKFVDTTHVADDGALTFELVRPATRDVVIAYWVVDSPKEGTPTTGPP
jgi:hypothetical protein